MREKLSLDDIIDWIVRNHENTRAIDKINSITFPFTSKYLDNVKKKKEPEHRKSIAEEYTF